MVETAITILIYLCILALVVYLVFWVLESIGLVIPQQIKNIIIIICVLVAILMVMRVLPGLGVHMPTLK